MSNKLHTIKQIMLTSFCGFFVFSSVFLGQFLPRLSNFFDNLSDFCHGVSLENLGTFLTNNTNFWYTYFFPKNNVGRSWLLWRDSMTTSVFELLHRFVELFIGDRSFHRLKNNILFWLLVVGVFIILLQCRE